MNSSREPCAVAGAQNVVRDHVRDHIALFGMLLYVYSEGVETITRSVSHVKFRAPWDWDPLTAGPEPFRTPFTRTRTVRSGAPRPPLPLWLPTAVCWWCHRPEPLSPYALHATSICTLHSSRNHLLMLCTPQSATLTLPQPAPTRWHPPWARPCPSRYHQAWQQNRPRSWARRTCRAYPRSPLHGLPPRLSRSNR